MPIIVSVIIPVYKAEAFLPDCLDSLLAQTMPEWEAVCVDDGSLDKCGSILDAYAAGDSRFRVIHQKNAGVSSARNAGIEVAQGEFLAFLDADDMLYPTTLERLVSLAGDHQADLVECSIEPFGDAAGCKSLEQYAKVVDSVQKPFVLRNLFFTRAYLWNKLVRKAVWGNMRLNPALTIGEDLAMNAILLSRISSFVSTSERLYRYRQVHSSAMHTTGQYEMLKSEVHALCDIADEWGNIGRLSEVSDDLVRCLQGFLLRRIFHLNRGQRHDVLRMAQELLTRCWRFLTVEQKRCSGTMKPVHDGRFSFYFFLVTCHRVHAAIGFGRLFRYLRRRFP